MLVKSENIRMADITRRQPTTSPLSKGKQRMKPGEMLNGLGVVQVKVKKEAFLDVGPTQHNAVDKKDAVKIELSPPVVVKEEPLDLLPLTQTSVGDDFEFEFDLSELAGMDDESLTKATPVVRGISSSHSPS